MPVSYKFADKFDYLEMGANIGTFCPPLYEICAVEEGEEERCPYWPDFDCPDEGEFALIVTEKGYVVPDPLEEGF